MKSLTTPQVLVETFHEHHGSSVVYAPQRYKHRTSTACQGNSYGLTTSRLLPIVGNSKLHLSLKRYSKVAENNSNKLAQMNSLIQNNLNTIQQNYSKRRHKVTGVSPIIVLCKGRQVTRKSTLKGRQ